MKSFRLPLPITVYSLLCLALVFALPAVAQAAPAISEVRSFPNPFSPNGDRVADTTIVSYATGSAGTVSLRIFDAKGEIKLLRAPVARAAGAYSEVWNGTNNLGKITAPGTYRLVVYLQTNGRITSYTSTITVLARSANPLPTGPAVEVSASLDPPMITPNGDGVNDLARLEYSVTGSSLVTARLYRGGKEVYLLQPPVVRGQGDYAVVWDGKDAGGRYVAPGTYRYVVAAQTVGGTEAARGTVKVRRAPQSNWGKVSGKILSSLARMREEGSLARTEAQAYELALWKATAILEEAELTGRTRERTDLGYVVNTIEALAEAGQLNPVRARILLGKILTINNEYFTLNPSPRYSYTPINSPSSALTYIYYLDEGIQFAPVPALNEARNAYRAADWTNFMEIANEISQFFVERSHNGVPFYVLEYYFSWEGSQPLWVSGMAQGIALEALGAAASHTGDSRYVNMAEKVLRSFEVPYNTGGVLSQDEHGLDWGSWYAAFAYSDRDRTLNTFMDTLIGLYRYSKLREGAPDGEWAGRLFRSGLHELKRHLNEYDLPITGVDPDTASWSHYSKVHGPARVHYHRYHVTLLRTFLTEIAPGDLDFQRYLAKWEKGLAIMEGVGGPKVLEHTPNRVIFSPDGDEEEDSVDLSYRLDRAAGATGYVVSLKVYNGKGEIKTVQRDTTLVSSQVSVSDPPVFSARWDGTDNKGQIVRDGSYKYVLYVTNPIAMTPATGVIRVRNAPALQESWADPIIISPDGDGQADAGTFYFNVDRAAEVSLKVLDYKGVAKKLLDERPMGKGKYTIGWTGTADNGSALPNGTYRWTLSAENGAGKTATEGIIVISVPKPIIYEVAEPGIVTPDGDGVGDSITFAFKTTGDGYLTLKVLNYKGVVKTVVPRSLARRGEQRFTWNGADDLGVALPVGGYRYVITLENRGGSTSFGGPVIVN